MPGKPGKAASTTTDLTIAASGAAGSIMSQGYYLAAGSTYALIAGAQITVAGSTAANAASLWVNDSVAGNGLARQVRAHGTADVTPVLLMAIITPTTDGWRHRTLRLQPGTADATAVSAAMCCIEVESGDQTASNDTTVTTTSATYQDGVSVTFTVGSGETWLVIGTADVQNSTANQAQIRLYDGTTAYGQGDSSAHAFTGSYYPWACIQAVTATGSQTFKVQYASANGTQTTSVKNQRLLAIKLPASAFATAADNTKTGTTSSSFTTRITATYAAIAGDHVVLATAWTEGSVANVPVGSRLTAGGALMLDAGSMSPNAGLDDVQVGFLALDAGVSAGSRSWTLDWKSDGTNTGRMMSARLAVIALAGMTEPAARVRRQIRL